MRKFLYAVIAILIIFSFTLSFSEPSTSEEGITGVSNAKENLDDLTLEEKNILEELFIIVQEVKEMEEVEKNTSLEIIDLKTEIVDMEGLIEEQTSKYNDNLYIMEQILKSHQKNGATTYLDLILSSDSLETLIRRINMLRDISRSTTVLLDELEDAKEKLINDKNQLQATLSLVETRQRDLQLALEKKVALKENLEARLNSLQDDKAKYESYLDKLENSWAIIKPVFSETITQLTTMIESGNLPEETIDIGISLDGVKGIIHEDIIREILAYETFPTSVDILFSKDNIQLSMPDIDIYMTGYLEILENKQSLVFKMQEGSYLGMKLEKSSMEELFNVGYLEFHFKKLLNKSTIRSIKINEDNLELIINPVLF